MRSTRRQFLFAITIAALATPLAHGQDYPVKPIRLIVPYAPGGTTDQMARILQRQLSEKLGQQVVVDNKPGAAGIIGVESAAHSQPDGYTLVFTNSGNSTISAFEKIPYDPVKDFQPISVVATVPLILAVRSSLPVDNVRDFISLARSKSGRLNYGSTGVGGASHLTTEYFGSVAGIKAEHVPYKGGAPGVVALRSEEIDMMFVTPLDGEAARNAGWIKYLGVGSLRSTDLIPGVPPIADTLPGFNAVAWFGVWAPAGVPAPIVTTLSSAIAWAISQPAVKDGFANLRAEPASSSPDEFGKAISAELAHWTSIAKDLQIRLD